MIVVKRGKFRKMDKFLNSNNSSLRSIISFTICPHLTLKVEVNNDATFELVSTQFGMSSDFHLYVKFTFPVKGKVFKERRIY